MRVHQLDSCDGFIVFDLDDTPTSAGRVHQARKIAVDEMVAPARGRTYQHATFGSQVGGAAAAVMAKPDARARVVKSFVSEVAPLVERHELALEPGPGVSADALRALRAVDRRHPSFWTASHQLRGRGAVGAAVGATGGLDGLTIGIEGFEAAGPSIVDAASVLGGRVVAMSTAKGSIVSPIPFRSDEIVDAYEFHGASFVGELGIERGPTEAILLQPVDVMFVGATSGALDVEHARQLACRVVVPTSPTALTKPTLDALESAGITVVPDFVSTAGPLFAMEAPPDADADQVMNEAVAAITARVHELDRSPLPMYEAACQEAEAFIRSWYGEPPVSRPLD